MSQLDLPPKRARTMMSMFISCCLLAQLRGALPSNLWWIRYVELHQSLSHDMAYIRGLRPEEWFRLEWSRVIAPQNLWWRKCWDLHTLVHNQNNICCTSLRNNLGGVTDRQTCADSVCYQTVNKYVKFRSNEHMNWRKCFHGHYI